MSYTFEPKDKHAKACGNNMRISRKAAVKICRVIRNKPLTRARRLLDDLIAKKRDLRGKYYTSAVNEIKMLLDSCEKNAVAKNLDSGKLMVHASAHQGGIFRRRRRKAAFGSRMKSANVEIMLIEKGKEKKLAKVKTIKKMEDLEKIKKELAEAIKKKAEK
ncbi:MAG: uL22 family ribosomal protein [Candidatus Aenigmatarchaeota archaeon]